MKLRLDLHTHCYEATHYKKPPTIDIVRQIVAAAKKRRLDGIAVTEHYDKDFGYMVKRIVEEQLDGEIIIIPGWEIQKGAVDVVQLDLADGIRFNFMAHPGCPRHAKHYDSNEIEGLHGIEIKNHMHAHEIDEENAKRLAEDYNLITLQNSDAHDLADIGYYCNEIDLQDLLARVKQTGASAT